MFSSFADDQQFHHGPAPEVLEKIEEELQERADANLAAVKRKMGQVNISQIFRPQKKAQVKVQVALTAGI